MKELIATLLSESQHRNLSAGELGQLADAYALAREARLAADKISARHKEAETMAEQLLINQMLKQEITAAGGSTLRVGLEGPDYVPHVKDWDKFYKFIKETESWDLLERRPGKAACRLRWEDGKTVPGVESFPVYKLSRNGVK